MRKIFIIEYEEGRFVKKELNIESEELKDVLTRWFVHMSVAKVKKKYYTLNCEQECDEVIADLNAHLTDRKDFVEGKFAVCKCKECGKLFILTYNTCNNFKKLGLKAPERCKLCIDAKRAAKEDMQ